MKIKCPKCDKIHEVQDIKIDEIFECACSYKFVIIEKDIPQSSNAKEDIDNDDSIPKIIGGYKIKKIIGEGGMGRVYLAKHNKLGIFIAIKTMLPGYGAIKNYAERFYREARTAAKINHPNVVRIYDCGNENDTLFIIMEYVTGGSTGDLLKKQGKLPSYTVINIAKDICQALIEAQKFGIIHRDIKPVNIMCDEDGVFKLADLGLAKQISPNKTVESLTIEATGLGTPIYMSPEQFIDAKSCDIRSDIYALGVTLYHLLCGKPPFESDSQLELFKMHSEKIPERPTKINPDIPEELEKIIGKCMGKTPDQRYSTPQEILDDLKRMREGKEILSLTPKGKKSTKKLEQESEEHSRNFFSLPLIMTISLVSILVVTIFLFLYISHSDNSKTKNKVKNIITSYHDLSAEEKKQQTKLVTEMPSLDKLSVSKENIKKDEPTSSNLPVAEKQLELTVMSKENSFKKQTIAQAETEHIESKLDNCTIVEKSVQIYPFDIFLNSLASDIISAKFAEAEQRCNAALHDEAFVLNKTKLTELLNQLRVINTSAELVQKELQKTVGKKAGLLIPKYKNYTIEKINGEKISLSKKSKKVKFGKTIKKNDLSDATKAYCIAKKNKTVAYIYLGSCEFRKKKYLKAKKYFRKAGLLSTVLLGQLPKDEQENHINSVKEELTRVANDDISIATIKKIFKGKVCSWNPKTRRIKLKYDFSDKKQLEDWYSYKTDMEVKDNTLIMKGAKKGFFAIFDAPIEMKELSFNVKATSEIWWFFNYEKLNFSKNLPGNGCMRRMHHDGGSCIYSTSGHISNPELVDENKKYSMEIYPKDGDLVWKVNGKTFIKNKYDKHGEICAIGGWATKGNKCIYDNLIIQGTVNKEWLEKKLNFNGKIINCRNLEEIQKEFVVMGAADIRYNRLHLFSDGNIETKQEINGNFTFTVYGGLDRGYIKACGITINLWHDKIPAHGDVYKLMRNGEKLSLYLNNYKNPLVMKDISPKNQGKPTKISVWDGAWKKYGSRIRKITIERSNKKTENIEKDRYNLIVTTKTNSAKYSDTNDNVYVSINGDESLKYALDNYNKNDRKRGAVDVFTLPVEYPISKIRNIKLIFDGHDAWVCDNLFFQFIKDEKRSRIYKFNLNAQECVFSSETKDKGIKEKVFLVNNVRWIKSLTVNNIKKQSFQAEFKGVYPKGTFEWKGHHYYALPPMTYKNAEETCRKLGGHILSIDNRKENEYFYTLASNKNAIYKLDVNNREKTKKWRNWEDKKPAYMPKGYKPRFLKPEMEKGAAVIGYTSSWYIFPIASHNRVICEWDH